MNITDLWGSSSRKLNEDYSPINECNVGDLVEIVGKVQGHGLKGKVKDTGKDGSFVVVDLGKHGIRSFQMSDVSTIGGDLDGDGDFDLDMDERAGPVSKKDWQKYWHRTNEASCSTVSNMANDALEDELDEHGGGIGPRQHWQKLMPETCVDERAGPVSGGTWQKKFHKTNECSCGKCDCSVCNPPKKQVKTSFVDESFNQPYPIQYREGQDSAAYIFTSDDGRHGVVRFLDPDGINEWELKFKMNGLIGVTGGGDAFRLWATVIEACKMFMRDHGNDVEYLVFTASEPSRQKLYDRLVRTFVSQFGLRLKESGIIKNGDKQYILENPNYAENKDLYEKNYPGQETPGIRSTARRKSNRTASYARSMLKPGRKSDEIRSSMISKNHPGRDVRQQSDDLRKRLKTQSDTKNSTYASMSANHLKGMKKLNKDHSTPKNKLTTSPLSESFLTSGWEKDWNSKVMERAGPVDTVRWAPPWIAAGRDGASLAKDIDYDYTQENVDNQADKPNWSPLESFYDYDDYISFDEYEIDGSEDSQGLQQGSAECELVNYEMPTFTSYDIETQETTDPEAPGSSGVWDDAPEEDTDPEFFDGKEKTQTDPYDLGYPTKDTAIKLEFPKMSSEHAKLADAKAKPDSTMKTSEKLAEAVVRVNPNIVLEYTDNEISNVCYEVSDKYYGKRLAEADYGILARQVLKILRA